MNDKIAYTVQSVIEATVTRSVLFEFFSILRWEVRFSLSLIKLRPFMFQFRKANTIGMTQAEKNAADPEICHGYYSEVRILPLTFELIANFQKCAYSFIHPIFGQDSPGLRCYFSPSNVMTSQSALIW